MGGGCITFLCSGASTMLLSRFRRTKPNAYWLGRSMEHLAVTGSSSPVPTSNSNLPGASPAGAVPTSSTPSKGRHRLATDPCSITDDSNDDIPKCNLHFYPLSFYCLFCSNVSCFLFSNCCHTEISTDSHCWRTGRYGTYHKSPIHDDFQDVDSM